MTLIFKETKSLPPRQQSHTELYDTTTTLKTNIEPSMVTNENANVPDLTKSSDFHEAEYLNDFI